MQLICDENIQHYEIFIVRQVLMIKQVFSFSFMYSLNHDLLISKCLHADSYYYVSTYVSNKHVKIIENVT